MEKLLYILLWIDPHLCIWKGEKDRRGQVKGPKYCGSRDKYNMKSDELWKLFVKEILSLQLYHDQVTDQMDTQCCLKGAKPTQICLLWHAHLVILNQYLLHWSHSLDHIKLQNLHWGFVTMLPICKQIGKGIGWLIKWHL